MLNGLDLTLLNKSGIDCGFCEVFYLIVFYRYYNVTLHINNFNYLFLSIL